MFSSQTMETNLLSAAIWGALLLMQCRPATPHPTVESVTYHSEIVDRKDDFSLQVTTYFSALRQAYRYDFNGGMNQLFIYPETGLAYFYTQTSDFEQDAYNKTACMLFSTPVLEDLPDPLPSLTGFDYLGQEHVRDIPAEKYVLNEFAVQREIWVRLQYSASGRPIRQVQKEWKQLYNGIKQSLNSHVTTDYYGLSVGEQHYSVWDRPAGVSCNPASEEDKSTIISLALTAGVNKELLQFMYELPAKNYKTGGRSLGVTQDEGPLKLPFPWSQAEYKKIAETLPMSFDWRDFGAVTPVKDQRACGSCWAFGAVGALEGAYFRKHNQLVSLSEQALVDCAGSEIPLQTNGCFGGWQTTAFVWTHHAGGIPPTAEYSPYQEMNGYCRITNQTKLVAQVEGFYRVPNDEDALRVALVKLGPVVVGVDASGISSYTNGVIRSCDKRPVNHAVLLVGYGETAEDGPYWIIKNSWDVNWGLDGYFLLSAQGDCRGILSNAAIPVLK